MVFHLGLFLFNFNQHSNTYYYKHYALFSYYNHHIIFSIILYVIFLVEELILLHYQKIILLWSACEIMKMSGSDTDVIVNVKH